MSASTAQKSAVVPSSGWKFSSVRCGQSAALMSQNRHSCALSTRFAGFSSASPQINAPSSEWTTRPPLLAVCGPCGPGRCLPSNFEGLVWVGCSRNRVQVDHGPDEVAGAVVAGLHVDDYGVVVPLCDQVRLPASVAGLPRSWKSFCSSMSALEPPFSQSAMRSFSSTVCCKSHSAWLKFDGVLVQSWYCALNQTAHSHEFSSVSSLGS